MAKSLACAQQMKDGLLLFLISAVSAEIVNKVFNTNAPSMRIHNAMQSRNHSELLMKRLKLSMSSTESSTKPYM